MLHVVLFQPNIPQNTGNVGRLCAFTGVRLHLIHPLGFEISDRYLRRAGMDYWKSLDFCEYPDWKAFRDCGEAPKKLWLFTTKGTKSYWDAKFSDGDALIFGSETKGAPSWLHEEVGALGRLKIPQMNPGLRSLNLATSVGVGVYEAVRQISFQNTK